MMPSLRIPLKTTLPTDRDTRDQLALSQAGPPHQNKGRIAEGSPLRRGLRSRRHGRSGRVTVSLAGVGKRFGRFQPTAEQFPRNPARSLPLSARPQGASPRVFLLGPEPLLSACGSFRANSASCSRCTGGPRGSLRPEARGRASLRGPRGRGAPKEHLGTWKPTFC